MRSTSNAVISLLVSVCILSSTARSQEIYPGYVINNSGDTLKGYIYYKAWSRNPASIRFVRTPGSNVSKYEVTDLKEFEVTGYDHYIRGNLKLDNRRLNTELAADYEDTLATVGWVRQLVKGGKLSLYSFYNDRPHYLIQSSGDTSFKELRYKNGFENGAMYDLKLYQPQLQQFLDDSSRLFPLVNQTNYNEGDLRETVLKINGMTPDTYKKETEHNRLRLKYFVGAGISFSHISLDDSHPYIKYMNFTQSTNPIFMAGIDVTGGRGLQNWLLRFDFSYYKVSYDGSGLGISGSQDYQFYHFSQSNFSSTISVGYYFMHTKTIRAYVAGSLALNFSSYGKNDYTYDYPDTMTLKKYLSLYTPWASVAPRVGVLIKNRVEVGVMQVLGSYQKNSSFNFNSDITQAYIAVRLN